MAPNSLSLLGRFLHVDNFSVIWIRINSWMYLHFPKNWNTNNSVNDHLDRPYSVDNPSMFYILMALLKIPSGVLFYLISDQCDPIPPIPCRDDYDSVSSATPSRPSLHTPGIGPASSDGPYKLYSYPLSVSHMPPLTCFQSYNMTGMQLSPYSTYLSEGRPSWRCIQWCRTPSAAYLFVMMQWFRHPHKNTPSSSSINMPSPSVLASISATTVTQWRMTASTNTLNSVCFRESDWSNG